MRATRSDDRQPARMLKVRHEPPTLHEAVAVARDLADTVEHQVAIVTGLMEISAEQAGAAIRAAQTGPERRMTRSREGERSLIVERRTTRLSSARLRRQVSGRSDFNWN